MLSPPPPASPTSMIGPGFLLLFFTILALVGDSLLTRIGFTPSPTEREWFGYVVGVGFWLCTALAVNRLLAVLLWNRMLTGPGTGGTPRLLIDLTSFALYSLAVTMIVGSVFGQSLTGFWATSGVLGLVLGFALRNLILDLFTGIAVNIEQPYRAGDWVEAHILGGPRVGRVVQMNWRTTRLVTEDGDIVIIPNGMLATLVVTNRGAGAGRLRNEVRVVLDFSIPTERARRILQAAAAQACDRPGFCSDPRPSVLVTDVGSDGVEYAVRYWTTVWKELSPSAARDLVTAAIVEHLRQAGLAPGHQKEDVFFAAQPPRQLDTLSDEDRAALLSRVELFRALRLDELNAVAAGMRRLTVRAGTPLLHAGDPGESMFIVVEGVLDVLVPDPDGGAPRKVSRLGPGEVFGEMSLLTGEPRSATITPVTDVLVYEVTRGPIHSLFDVRPEVAERISEVVAKRLATRRSAPAEAGSGAGESSEVSAGQLLGRIKAAFRGAWR